MITRIVPIVIPFRNMFVTARHFGRSDFRRLKLKSARDGKDAAVARSLSKN